MIRTRRRKWLGASFFSFLILGLIFAAPDARAQEPDSKDSKVRLNVRLAKNTIFPFEPVPVLIELVNEGDEDASVATILDPSLLDVRVRAQWPGEKKWRGAIPYSYTRCVVRAQPKPRTLVKAGSRVTVQTDVFMDLGYDSKTKEYRPGLYRLRFSLRDLEHRVSPVAPVELPIAVRRPVGKDREILEGLLKKNRRGYLAGTRSHNFAGAGDLREELAAIKAITTQHPDSAYTPDLRVGYLTMALKVWPVVAKKDGDRGEGIRSRMRSVAEAIGEKNAPSAWPRAEVNLLLAEEAISRPDIEAIVGHLRMFLKYCPDDVRAKQVRERIELLSRYRKSKNEQDER